MPSISNVSLLLANGSTQNTRNVTVSGTLNFDAGEVGKSYRLEIKLFGEDKSGDLTGPGDFIGDDELYSFSWGFFPYNKPYKQITVAAAGAQNFTETRTISNEKLDEDSGLTTVKSPAEGTPDLPGPPRRDEVYARVSLAGAPVIAKSPTVIASPGV